MAACRLCGGMDLLPILDFGEHPIAHRLLSDPSETEYVHSVALEYCESCGLVQISDPIPKEELYTRYNWLSSWKWNPHMNTILGMIENTAGVEKGSRILEVASNDGTFIQALMGQGYTNVLGLEPATDAFQAAREKGVETINSYFNCEAAQKLLSSHGPFDLFVARQVLEHISDLAEFREAMRMLLSPGAYLYIEVPNGEFTLSSGDYSGIWEEHVNYFGLGTLTSYLAEAGIQILHSETANFCGEALMVLARYVGDVTAKPSEDYLESIRAQSIQYREQWPVFRDGLVNSLVEHRDKNGMIAVYGAGHRAGCLINYAGLGPMLEFVADDQPEKQGMYMPGSRLPIVSGEDLAGKPVDLCLLAVNAESEDTVMAKHAEYLRRGGRFASILPPSDRLLPVWDRCWPAVV